MDPTAPIKHRMSIASMSGALSEAEGSKKAREAAATPTSSRKPLRGRDSMRNTIHPTQVFSKQICGDLFGTMAAEPKLRGLLYHSRIEDARHRHDTLSIRMEEEARSDTITVSTWNLQEGSDSEDSVTEDMTTHQRLARTLRNWSRDENNSVLMMNEGAVQTIIGLSAIDDVAVRDDVVSALYFLSRDPSNRSILLELGATSVIAQISSTTKKWKIGKLCAFALSQLSMHEGTEAIMAREAIVGLTFILQKFRRLVSVCLDALYNLTCVPFPYTGIERVIKPLLGSASLPYGTSRAHVLQGICNCVRFEALRSRIIQDGALQILAGAANGLSKESTDHRFVFCIAMSVRLLSDSKHCLSDIISKGGIETLNLLLPFCSKEGVSQVVKSLHNTVRYVTIIPAAIRRLILGMIIRVCEDLPEHTGTRQHMASLLYGFIKSESTVPDCLLLFRPVEVLIACDDAFSVLFVSLACKNMYKRAASEWGGNSVAMEQLGNFTETLVQLIEGISTDDLRPIEAVAQLIAEMCDVPFIRDALGALHLVPKMLAAVLKLSQRDSEVAKSYCCKILCLLSDCFGQLTEAEKAGIANLLNYLLFAESTEAIVQAVSGIFCVVERNICNLQLLSCTLIDRIIEIVSSVGASVRVVCGAILANFSYDSHSHEFLCTPNVLQALFSMAGLEDDNNTRLCVAICLCNISVTDGLHHVLIEQGTAQAVSRLSCGGSESIQELCARIFCNLTRQASLHSQLLKQDTVGYILMIALVRSVGYTTKKVCGRALLNTMTTDNIDTLVDAGVARAFANLSQLDCEETQDLCALAFVTMTGTLKGRVEITSRINVLKALFGLVRSNRDSTKMLVGRSLCNLIKCEESKGPIIRAGGLAVLKIIATMNFDHLQEDCCRVLIILSRDRQQFPFLLREDIIPVLVLFSQSTVQSVFEGSIKGLSALSCNKDLSHTLVEIGCVSALIHAILSCRVSPALVEPCVRCFFQLSFDQDKIQKMLKQHVVLGLRLLYHLVTEGSKFNHLLQDVTKFICATLRNFSCARNCSALFLESGGFELMSDIAAQSQEEHTVTSASIVVYNLSIDTDLHVKLITNGLLQMFQNLNVQSTEQSLFTVCTIHVLSESPQCCKQIVETNVCNILRKLIRFSNAPIAYRIASSLRHLSLNPENREQLVQQGAVDIIAHLSESSNHHTRQCCADTLGYLSQNTLLHTGTVSALLDSVQDLKEHEDNEFHSPNRRLRRLSSEVSTLHNHGTPEAMDLYTIKTQIEWGEAEYEAAWGQRLSSYYTTMASDALRVQLEPVIAVGAGMAPALKVDIAVKDVPVPALSFNLSQLELEPIAGMTSSLPKYVTTYDQHALPPASPRQNSGAQTPQESEPPGATSSRLDSAKSRKIKRPPLTKKASHGLFPGLQRSKSTSGASGWG